jgi:aldose 1-epimerase
LTDAFHKIGVSVVPSYGNNAYEMKVNGTNVFWTPTTNPAEMKAKPRHLGNPFLAPWANRLDQDGFYANGKYYRLNPDLKNFGRDPFKQPIHGLVVYATQWEVAEVRADHRSAWVTSRLEAWRYPDLMAQFPFAHTLEMTYRLQDGVLEVETKVTNHAKEPMPVSIAYHPYFTIHDAPRDEWRVSLPVREHLTLSDKLIPTGEVTPASYPDALPLAGKQLDDVFSGLIRGESGRAEFSVLGKSQKISVLYGPKYKVAVVYAPPGRDFICFEPMTGPTNAFNNAQTGKYSDLQSIPPGQTWSESFWIHPTGY